MLLLAWASIPAAGVAAPFLVGVWYGEEQPKDPNVFWLARFFPDGRFHALFRTCHGKEAFDEDDTGTWSLRDGMLEVTSTLVNGHQIRQVERYHTLSYDGHKHVYRHERTGFVFSAVKVRNDYELPACGLSS